MALLTVANVTLQPQVAQTNLSVTWALDIVIPKVVVSDDSGYRAGWSLDISLPPIRIESALARKWSIDQVMPMAQIDAAVYARIEWALDIELPVVYIEGNFYAIDATSNIAFCLNPSNRAHSDYTNYGFSSFCKFSGEYLGCDAAGISRLSGENDDATPIDSRVLFGVVDDGSSVLSRVDSAIVNLRHDGDMDILMQYDEREINASRVDFDPMIDPAGIHTRRAKFSRGGEGRNLQLGFENASGADFEITEIEVITVPLSRHE